MDSRKFILSQTAIVAAGEALGCGILFAVFAAIGRWDTTVLLGGIAGAVLAILNFLGMALAADAAAKKATNQDVKGGQTLVQISYMARMVGLFVLLFLCFKTGYCNAIALVLPLVFVRPTLTLAELLRKKGETNA